ncbi:MAG: ABC transporter permease [Defluviitaleaceae bacterium]|nr:ABC transporter permease [Defluviitaleaceae bacterium]
MRSVQAIFVKQAKDMTKNFSVLIMFVIFPLVAFGMTHFVARGNDDISDTMFTTMMAGIFVGMALIQSACTVIAEDREKKSLRFLVIAGVKPLAYLLGIGGVIFIASVLSSLAFGYIGGFSQDEFIAFMLVMMSGAIASIILGATIGIYAKNQQAATGLSMPVAVVLGFAPMVAQFNERVENFAGFFYTQQINVVVNNFSEGVAQPLAVIWINIAVLAVLFVIAYVKKGLKE